MKKSLDHKRIMNTKWYSFKEIIKDDRQPLNLDLDLKKLQKLHFYLLKYNLYNTENSSIEKSFEEFKSKLFNEPIEIDISVVESCYFFEKFKKVFRTKIIDADFCYYFNFNYRSFLTSKSKIKNFHQEKIDKLFEF